MRLHMMSPDSGRDVLEKNGGIVSQPRHDCHCCDRVMRLYMACSDQGYDSSPKSVRLKLENLSMNVVFVSGRKVRVAFLSEE